MSRLSLAAALLVLAGCAADPAPADLDGLAQWFWRHYDDASDGELHEALGRLEKVLPPVEDPVESTLAPLPTADLALVEMAAPGNAATARGLLLITRIRCPLPEVEALFVEADQHVLHPSFDKFTRTFTSDLEAWRQRDPPTVTWQNAYTVSLFGSTYDAIINGGARFIAKGSNRTAILASRAWLPAAAKFNNDDDFFRQDYQVHLLWERTAGEVVHLFAFWREIRFGGLDMDDDTFVSGVLSNIAKGDEEIEERCRE